MPVYQVKDILEHIRAYHRSLSQQLDELSVHETDERLRLLTKHIARHEVNFNRALARYEHGTAQGVLNTWLRFVPEESVDSALKEIQLSDDMSAEEILASVLAFDQSLIELYHELTDETPLPRIQELFNNLLEMERNNERQFSLTVLGLSDD